MMDRRKGDRRITPLPLAKPPPGLPERRQGLRRALDRLQQELVRELELLAGLHPRPAALFEQVLAQIGRYLAASFQVGEDEVGILLVKDQDQLLRFAYPLELYRGKVNLFPIAAPSVAGWVVQGKRGALYNDMTMIPHLRIYERIRLASESARPVQKMLAAPLLDPDGHAVGVLEVCRKAPTLQEAGPDFSELDLLKLTDFGRALAVYLVRFLPEEF